MRSNNGTTSLPGCPIGTACPTERLTAPVNCNVMKLEYAVRRQAHILKQTCSSICNALLPTPQNERQVALFYHHSAFSCSSCASFTLKDVSGLQQCKTVTSCAAGEYLASAATATSNTACKGRFLFYLERSSTARKRASQSCFW